MKWCVWVIVLLHIVNSVVGTTTDSDGSRRLGYLLSLGIAVGALVWLMNAS